MDSCNSYLIVNLTLLKKEGLVNLCHDVQMNFADNWARIFVVITFLTFGEAQIIGGIVPNLIAFGCSLERLDTLLQLEKWLKCSAGKTRNKQINSELRELASRTAPDSD